MRGDEFQRLAANVHREVLRFNRDSVYLSSSLEKCRREWLREGSDSCTPFHGVLAIELFLNVMTSYITMVTLVIIAFSLNEKTKDKNFCAPFKFPIYFPMNNTRPPSWRIEWK